MPSDPQLPAGFSAGLVAADLDGTLLAPDLSFSPGLPDVLLRLRSAGVATVVCTGRMFRSARVVAGRLGLHDGPIVCYQGAMVADLATGEPLRHVRMKSVVAGDVVVHARSLGLHINAYIDDRLYVEQLNARVRDYAEYVEVGIGVVEDLAAEVTRRAPTKLVVIMAASDVERLLPGLQERWRGRLYVTRSQPEYVEFTDASVSKSRALEWLCGRLGVPRERVVALGDGMNDVDMLQWAGVGVAVAEAAAAVRAAADLVVPRSVLPSLLEDIAERAGRATLAETTGRTTVAEKAAREAAAVEAGGT